MRNKFKKSEKLKSKIAFTALFSGGESSKHYPVRIVFIPWENLETNNPQVAFSVSKRKFKKAVDRNRIKRQLRECYRLNKHELLTNLQQSYAIVFIYLHHQNMPYTVLNEALKDCLKSLVEFDKQIMKVKESR